MFIFRGSFYFFLHLLLYDKKNLTCVVISINIYKTLSKKLLLLLPKSL